MLIILDIDGVMVPAKSWSSPPLLEDGFAMFNLKSIVALNCILSQSNADILLTTSHKDRYTTTQWISLFNNRDIAINTINKLPANNDNLSRRDEITKWFYKNRNVPDFVILDDDKSLNGLPDSLKSRLILTQPLIGLTAAHVQDSLRILNTPLELV